MVSAVRWPGPAPVLKGPTGRVGVVDLQQCTPLVRVSDGRILGDDLGIATENTAKWQHNHLLHGTTFQPGQLVIIDETSLAGALSLDRITHLAHTAGTKVLLVGDYAQLQSVDACGAFTMITKDRADTLELVDVHRFTHAWEKTASLALRHRHPHVIDTCLDHQRITDGDHDTMTDAAYTAWRADLAQGLVSLLIAETREDVSALNTCVRVDLFLDGTLTIRKPGRRFGDSILLPAAYVAEHIDLGYAVTAYRAQGTTTDTAHALVEPTSARETFYVATHGRHSSHAYVTLDCADDHTQPHPGDNPNATARSVLYRVLQHSGAELSAHKTIAAVAQRDRWATLLRTSGLTTDDADPFARSYRNGKFAGNMVAVRSGNGCPRDRDEVLHRASE